MKKHLLFLAALIMIAINATRVNAQTEVYADGNATILQLADGWQVLHGSNIVAHGDGVLDVKNLPPAFKDFLYYYSRLPLDKSPRKSLSKNTSPTYGPLLRTQWNQYSPYNDLCPESDGQHCLTGCTTIATAQLLFYYQYCKPLDLNGQGTSPCNDLKSEYIVNISHYDGVTFYDYKMSYTPDFNKIATDETERARFIAGVAFAQKAHFGVNETGTDLNEQWNALENEFGYTYENFGIADLSDRSIVSDAIQKGCPILITGYNEYNNGHSFIIDGYNGNEFHINYGWGGSSDGWFTYTLFPVDCTVTIAQPKIDNYAPMQKQPNSIHIVGNNINKTIGIVAVADGNGLSYMQSEDIELEAGEYEFYYEYPDGSTIAPYTPSPVDLESGFASIGLFSSSPAKIKLSNSYKVDFHHDVSKGEISVTIKDYKMVIKGTVLDAKQKPVAGAIVAVSTQMPENEVSSAYDGNASSFYFLETYSQPFVPAKQYLNRIDFMLEKNRNPEKVSVAIQNGLGTILWQDDIPGDKIMPGKWIPIEFEKALEVNSGETYFFVLKSLERGQNFFVYGVDSKGNMPFRCYSTDINYVKTNANGEYTIEVYKYSSDNLSAFLNGLIFEPTKFDNIQENIEGQNFNGISAEVTISGKVLDKNSKPLAGALVSTSETKPKCDALQKNDNEPEYYCIFSSISQDFVPTRPYITSVDFCVTREGDPKTLTVSIQNEFGEPLWEKTLTGLNAENLDWQTIELEKPLEVTVGSTYYFTLTNPEGDEDNCFRCCKDADWNMLYRVWTSEQKYVKTDKNGNYTFDIDRYSNATLHAFYEDKSFSEINLTNVEDDISEQNFVGDFETPISEISANDAIRIWSYEKTIYVQNGDKEIRIADMQGRLVKTAKATADRLEIPMQKSGIYIVKTGAKTQKVMIR